MSVLFNEVENIFEQSKSEAANSSLQRKSTIERKTSLISGKLRMSKGTSSIPELCEMEKTKSMLSVKDNPELVSNLDQILSLIDKINDEIKHEQEESKFLIKATLMNKLLDALVLLSQNNDNHIPIINVLI